MKQVLKCDITQFDFEQFLNKKDDFQAFVKSKGLTNHTSWMMPQILAYYGGWKVCYTDEGKVSPLETFKANMKTDWDSGIWTLVTRANRSALVSGQCSNRETAKFGALTPIILAGIKEYQGIPYSAWNLSIKDTFVMPSLLLQAMCEPLRYEFTTEELINIREIALIKGGERRKPSSAADLYKLTGTPFADMNKYIRNMLTQTWLAHPSIRHRYMVLDHTNWDIMPVPLDDINIMKEGEELPWLTRIKGKSFTRTEEAEETLPWNA